MYKQYENLQLVNLKKIVLHCLNNLKGQDIFCVKTNKKNNITDLIIICTGRSHKHVISIAQDIYYKIKNIGFKYSRIEGLENGEWILVDLGSIIIHIMQKEIRKLYNLEKLWNSS